ncbi:MAG: 16S rRNA (uracil(1498)-N(3))-methyltransferase [Gammaproteobacteria bacterium]|nr:16S rRNA (uracil(1498)-N(3))-methyltransferase [Gammaproteobacteria bacterium]NND58848.1 16S rRNA (uracil(1498)-N(3))-methyltransferase [Gammaproteobacteria bacterium]
MRINRLFLDRHLHPGLETDLEADAAHHLTRVLRLRAGATLQVFDGRGQSFEATLLSATRRGGRLRVEHAIENQTRSPLRVTLVQGVSRGERMDLVIQKATELGVERIVPLLSDRSVVRLDATRRARRSAHWQRIMTHACEQSGRSWLPTLDEATGFDEWLASLQQISTGLLLQPGAARRFRDLPAPADDAVTVVIGPEGGLAPREVELLLERQFTGINLGPRILRTETAAIAILAMIQSGWGDA